MLLKRRLAALSLCAAILLCVGCSGKEQEGAEADTVSSSSQLPDDGTVSQQPSVRIPNPISPVESPEEFAALGFKVTAPQNASEAAYSTIAKTTAQVTFLLGGKEFCHRAAEGMQWQMLSGVYESFDEKTVSIALDDDRAATLLTVSGKGGRLAYWSRGEVDYTLYTAEAATDEEMTALIKELAGK